MDIYTFVGILGLVIISIGVFWQKKYIEDLLYMIGGASLFLYSYHINEWIFIPFSALSAANRDFLRHGVPIASRNAKRGCFGSNCGKKR